MNKNENKNKLIPELRFPEFEKEVGWDLKQVQEYFDVRSSKRVLQKDWANKGVPFYRTRELVSLSKNEAFNSSVFISEELYCELKEKYGVPLEGDFLISGVGTLGISYQVKENDKFYFKDGNVLWFKKEGDLHSTYFKYYFESDHIQNQINNQTSKSTVGTYTIQNARKTEFWHPTNKKEQQKIANCLSSIDEVISAHKQKLDALEDHKKGLLQNLFPQEGETVPKYRFAEFKNDGDWEEKSFEELFVIGNGRDYKHLDKGDIPVYGSGGYMLSVNDYLYDGESVCIGRKGTIDKPIFLKNKFWTVDTLFYTHSFNDCLPKFIYYIFQNINWLLHNEASGVPSLSKKNIYKIKTLIPKPKEQIKIVYCLSTLEDLIIEQTEKIEQLQLHKKGLMQGLFPKIIE